MPGGSRTGQAFALLHGGHLHKIRIPLPGAARDTAMPAGRGCRRGAGHRALRAGLRGDRLAGIPTRGALEVWLFLAWFSPGNDLDPDTLSPFPALYLAQDAETAFREKFQLPSTGRVDGLRPEELALGGDVGKPGRRVHAAALLLLRCQCPSAMVVHQGALARWAGRAASGIPGVFLVLEAQGLGAVAVGREPVQFPRGYPECAAWHGIPALASAAR